MTDAELNALAALVGAEGHDPAAGAALRAELERRGVINREEGADGR